MRNLSIPSVNVHSTAKRVLLYESFSPRGNGFIVSEFSFVIVSSLISLKIIKRHFKPFNLTNRVIKT